MKAGIIFQSFTEAIRMLPEDYQLEMYQAYMDYLMNGDDYNGDNAVVKAMLHLMKPSIDKSAERYENCVKNGKKGGRPKKEETEPEPEKNQSETKRKPEAKPKENPDETFNKDKDKDMDKDKDIKEKPTYVGLKKNPTNNPSVDMLRARSGTKWDAYIADFLRQREAKP